MSVLTNGFLILLVVLVVVTIAKGLRIVRPNERGVVERLGKYARTVDPGLRLIIPYIDHMRKVNIAEVAVNVPKQGVITKDNATVEVDAVVFYMVTEPYKSIYNVVNFQMALTILAQTNLRNVIGGMVLDQTLSSREQINANLRIVLDDATSEWGAKVTRVEVQTIEPPGDVMQAMHRQMKAEREKRAMILEAEGKKQSAILEAEGQRQAAIVKADGEAQAIKLVADADRYQKETVAQGEAAAVTSVFGAIKNAGPDEALVQLRYIEALKAGLANESAEKIFFPAEMSALAGLLAVGKGMIGSEGTKK
ncbi:MAG: SPFH/Band 7/PHB domain protein [Nitrospirae bacterium]|nr:SPFH/Band 7/PHB domain protein [Nitrospirota bacterium]